MKRWGLIDWMILAAGAAVRALFLTWPIAGDEACDFLWYVRQPLPYLVSTYDKPTNHIFQSLLMHASWVAFGPIEALLRLPVFLAGIGTIALAWWFAYQETKDVRIARLTAVLVAFSSYLVHYSASGRGYSIQVFLVLVLAIMARASTWPFTSVSGITALSVIGFLLLYTMPSGVIFLLPLYIYLKRPEQEFEPSASHSLRLALYWTGSLTLLAYGPLYQSFLGFSHHEAYGLLPTLTRILREFQDGLLPGAVMGLLFFAGMVATNRYQGLWRFLSLMLFLYVTLAAVIYPFATFPLFFYRNYGPLYPLAYFACALGAMRLYDAWVCDSLDRPFLKLGFLGLLTVCLTATTAEYVWDTIAPFEFAHRVRRDGRTMAHSLAPLLQPGDCLRGDPTNDGVVLFESTQHGRPDLNSYPIKSVYLIAQNVQEAIIFVGKEIGTAVSFKVLGRQGLVQLYRITALGGTK